MSTIAEELEIARAGAICPDATDEEQLAAEERAVLLQYLDEIALYEHPRATQALDLGLAALRTMGRPADLRRRLHRWRLERLADHSRPITPAERELLAAAAGVGEL
jgi:hypothetical protein